jgi:hypothetical protein
MIFNILHHSVDLERLLPELSRKLDSSINSSEEPSSPSVQNTLVIGKESN